MMASYIVHLGAERTLETQHLPLACRDHPDGQLGGEGGEGVGPGDGVLTSGGGEQEEQTWNMSRADITTLIESKMEQLTIFSYRYLVSRALGVS